MNYWAPLDTIKEDKEDEEERINNTAQKEQQACHKKENKLTRRLTRRQQRRNEQQIIIDSGATSHFVSDDIILPNIGQMQEEVFLPDGSTLCTAHKILLPFAQLSTAAPEAAVLPGLKKSFACVNKWAEEGYTTIFHPGDNGVTVHKPNTLTMVFGKPPVSRRYKPSGAKLWTMSLTDKQGRTENSISNVCSLPSTAQAIKYLHAAAGYPVNDTWINAINAGNYITWPGLTAKAVRRHFPQSGNDRT